MPRAKKTDTAAPSSPRLVPTSSRPQPAPTTPVEPAPAPAVAYEQIAMRAYELFLEDGGVHGRDFEHWLRAEQQLCAAEVPERPARRVGGRRTKA